MQTYTIQITEYQRQIIMQALTGAGPSKLVEPSIPNQDGETVQGEFILLIGMFGTLDSIEAANPGTVHGFSL